ncbi:hypothetical protein LBMAG56_40070 [Verrucomicrobiota bacterium]|nr:hypothetical protein LBMAG56_40070 [Verrucomicrobiota bacterium]
MLAALERRLVATARPVKPAGRPPTLLRRHPPEDGELLGAGLFIGKHGGKVRGRVADGKPAASAKFREQRPGVPANAGPP